MNFTVHDVDQRSPEWAALRAGLVTGSCANALIAVRKKGTGELAVRRDLRSLIVCEVLTQAPIEKVSRKTDAMARGVEFEPDAVAAYELATNRSVYRVGFIAHNTLKAGCSPDGYVGEWEGIVETKCPNSITHMEYIEAGVVPEEYFGQLVHSMWLTGAEWADFVSYDPRFKPAHLQLFIKRVNRADVDMTAYELAVTLFLSEVEKQVDAAMRRGAEVAA